MSLPPSLHDTIADPAIQRAMRQPVRVLCCVVLGKHGEASGWQFRDNDGMARCGFEKPCPVHDKKEPQP